MPLVVIITRDLDDEGKDLVRRIHEQEIAMSALSDVLDRLEASVTSLTARVQAMHDSGVADQADLDKLTSLASQIDSIAADPAATPTPTPTSEPEPNPAPAP